MVGWGATYKFDGSCVLRYYSRIVTTNLSLKNKSINPQHNYAQKYSHRQAHKKIYANHDQLCLDSADYVLDRWVNQWNMGGERFIHYHCSSKPFSLSMFQLQRQGVRLQPQMGHGHLPR